MSVSELKNEKKLSGGSSVPPISSFENPFATLDTRFCGALAAAVVFGVRGKTGRLAVFRCSLTGYWHLFQMQTCTCV